MYNKMKTDRIACRFFLPIFRIQNMNIMDEPELLQDHHNLPSN